MVSLPAKKGTREKAEKGKGITFDEIWTQFYRPQAESNKSAKSWKREESLYRIWISPAIGECPFANVSAPDLERIKSNMAEKRSQPTLNTICVGYCATGI
ncbi:hypothetical protein [Maridesulfovibrio ferrireducens]|uniref:hypothetical protein n=1 Tax=Maridesulfovibrio ferrireducens TaxID=246191 RepID=UPI000B81EEEB|nr:hypothetical protein [Maridesulfovibrio ferrireducens]